MDRKLIIRGGMAAGAGVAAVLGFGIARAAIPDSSGGIHACCNKLTGTLRVISSSASVPRYAPLRAFAQGLWAARSVPACGAAAAGQG